MLFQYYLSGSYFGIKSSLKRRLFAARTIFVFAAIFISRPADAGVEPYRTSVSAPFTQNQTLTLTDPRSGNQVISSKSAVALRINDNVSIGVAFTFTAEVKIEYYTSLPETTPTTLYKTLTINYNPLQGTGYKQQDEATFDGAVKIVTTVLSSNVTGTLAAGSVQLVNSMNIDRGGIFDPTAPLMGTFAFSGNFLNLSWSPVSGAAEYDIEWTTINDGNSYYGVVNKKRQGGAGAQSDAEFNATLENIFRDGASRITTDAFQYQFSLVTTDPLLLVRFRAIHYLSDGIRQAGNWNYRQNSGTFNIFDVNGYWHEPGLNWSYSAAFAEEAKKKEVVEYLDGSMRNRQTVTINNSDAVPVIQEAIYDDLGRPVAQILPAPHTGANAATYLHLFRNFNVKATGTPFTFQNSLNTVGLNCEINPGGLNTVSGAANYYSPANKLLDILEGDKRKRTYNSFIPDATDPNATNTGYPFSVTQYTPDKTGRVKLSGGVGLDFQPGKIADPGSHTSKFYYGVPEQWELNQLFGNDVGFANRYTRNMVIDPNGQISLSYQNGSGKTIATALAGAVPGNVDALPSFNDPENSSTHVQKANILSSDKFYFNATELTLTATATHLATVIGAGTLTYDVQKLINEYPGGAFKLCNNCHYKLTVKVTDDCGNPVGGTAAPVPVGALTADCNDTQPFVQSVQVDFNHIGAYFVTMELAFDREVLADYTENFVEASKASGFLEYQFDYIRSRFLDELNTSSCYSDCHTCQIELNSKSAFVAMVKQKFTDMGVDDAQIRGMSLLNWTNNLYAELLARCQAMQATCSYSPCDDLRNVMLMDVSPGGQYALFDNNGNALEPLINVIALNFPAAFPKAAPGSDLYEENKFSYFINGEERITSPNDANFTLGMLLAYWRPQWAEKFLKFHPEHCRLLDCINQSAYKIWDLKLGEVNRVADLNVIPATPALVYNAGNSEGWLLQSDPFFKDNAPGAKYRPKMREDLDNYSKNVLKVTTASIKTLIKFVEFQLYCADASGTVNTSYVNNATDIWQNCTPLAACRLTDREWQLYREYYLSLKQKYYAQLTGCPENPACPIGQPLAYNPPGTAPTLNDFQVSESTNSEESCIGHQISVNYKGSYLSNPVTIRLTFPDYANTPDLPDRVTINSGQQSALLCLPESVPASAVRLTSFITYQIKVIEGDNYSEEGDCNVGAPVGQHRYRIKRESYVQIFDDQNQPVTNHGIFKVAVNVTYSNPSETRTHILTIPAGSSISNTKILLILQGCLPNDQTAGNLGCASLVYASSPARVISYCNPPDPVVPAQCQLYVNKTPRFNAYNDDPGQSANIDINLLQEEAQKQLKAQATELCQENAVRWVAELEPGLVAKYPDEAQRNLIRAQLISRFVDVCSTGADKDNPFGVSELAPPDLDGDLQSPSGTATASPASLTTSGYYSFGDVIKKTVLANGGFTMTLNPWLINGPGAFYPKPQLSLQTVSRTSEGLCNRLAALKAEAASKGKPLFNHLSDTYGTAMTLTSADLNLLEAGCGNCRFLLAKDLTLPVFLDDTNNGSITPADFTAAMTAFQNVFAAGALDAAHANYPGVMRNFLNERFGFTLNYQDYKDYADFINANPGTQNRLINRVAVTSVAVDPNDCLKNILGVALSSGQAAYAAYLEEHREKFRTDYINTCRLAAINANLETTQQLYHYTLYYYDQADNLIRTIPPEGVKLLDVTSPVINAQINDARSYDRTEGQAEFQENLPYIINNDKTGALNKLSATMTSTSPRAIECWLYAASGSKQFIAQTPDQAFLFQVCASGNYLNVDMYKAVPGTNAIQYTLSRHFAADISKFVHPWTHVVIQSANLMTGALQVYCNGQALENLPDVNAACGWEVQSTANGIVYPENIGTLKHLRFYERILPLAEISANARHLTFVPSNRTGMTWYRFNIPPAGGPTTIASNTTDETRLVPLYPEHVLPTTYAYNSTNQVVTQSSPDGGTVNYWYDLLSRPVASQNDVQKPLFDYSYTRYDALGRIDEVGKRRFTTDPLGAPNYLSDFSTNYFYGSGAISEVTRTYYDIRASLAASRRGNNGVADILSQNNLRKRVSATTYSAAGGAAEQATYYDYDLSGNVRTVWQQISGLTGNVESGLKRMDYEYDLISGKVNFVRYQNGQPDQFFYSYEYDAENRLTKAWSGTRAMINSVTGSSLLNFDKKLDAAYYYYLHGPLARMELGDEGNKVQGVDYAYTLQGWLKGVNSGLVTTERDMGTDAWTNPNNKNNTIGADAFGYALYYFRSASGGIDYRPLRAAKNPFEDFTAKPIASLYNGNIAGMSVNVPKLNDPHHYNLYRYDQLNRIKSVDVLSAAGTAITDINSYEENFAYDANGNIQQLQRRGASGVLMDDLNYAYNLSAGKLVNNRLRHVTDAANDAAVSDDLKTQGIDNYSYDAIGNLKKDIQAGITPTSGNNGIQWNIYGKIVSLPGTNAMSYTYDASGNRVGKIKGDKTTWYVRDAQGNTMALYEKPTASSAINWLEQHLYGSSRLGIWKPEVENIAAPVAHGVTNRWNALGFKQYELSNHLGNVLTTVTDRRIQHIGSGNTMDYLMPDVVSAQDYYAFGGLMPGRTESTAGYRYGFNGKENDNDIGKGTGNQQDYGMRIYDPRIAKFLSVDPITAKYPELTPYQFASNTPIQASDLDGLEADYSKAKVPIEEYKNDELWMESSSKFIENTYKHIYNGAVDMAETGINSLPIYNLFVDAKGYKKIGKEVSTNLNNFFLYITFTPPEQIREDQVNALKNPHTWEQGAAMLLTHKISNVAFKVKAPSLSLTTQDGFLLRGFNMKAPFDIPVQRFGNMSLGRPDFWGVRIGTNRFLNRTFNAIIPDWNPLTQYTTGVIPRGTPIRFGIVGPQGWRYPGGSMQFIINSKNVTQQASKIIE